TCGGDRCTNECSFCNLVRCTGGTWTQEEAFPNPNCNDASDGSQCSYPPVNNDPLCPRSFSHTYQGQVCPRVGITCSYPGAGDGEGKGCFVTAMRWCYGDGGIGDLGDGGTDAGSGFWTTAQ